MDIKKQTPTNRRSAIKNLLLIDGSISVEELAFQLKVSVATIRRDLSILENTGFVQRTHGGAMVSTPRGADQAFSLREQTDQDAKRVIARAAVGLIDIDRTLFLNDGSTMLALARDLITHDLSLTVATSGINVATTLSENPRIQAYLAGGLVRSRTLGTSGSFVEYMLSHMYADIAFIAAESINPKDGLTFSYEEDASIARKMSERAKRTIVLVTSRKLAGRDRFTALSAEKIDLLITDCDDPKVIMPFEKAGISVLTAKRTPDQAPNIMQFTK